MRLKYVIKYVADMSEAVAFFRDRLGMELRFQSPFWTEFDTGDTTLALHPATARHPAESTQLGLHEADLDGLYATRGERGLIFGEQPHRERGVNLASVLDSDGVECGISGE
jgi:lactoylglutathione lyase